MKVLVADDHRLMVEGIRRALEGTEDIEVVGEAENGKEGVRLAKELKPDVILMDLVMEEMDGIEATKEILKENPQARIIVLTSFVDDEKVYPVIEAGAMSYLLKTTRAPQIAEAIRAAEYGVFAFSGLDSSKYGAPSASSP